MGRNTLESFCMKLLNVFKKYKLWLGSAGLVLLGGRCPALSVLAATLWLQPPARFWSPFTVSLRQQFFQLHWDVIDARDRASLRCCANCHLLSTFGPGVGKLRSAGNTDVPQREQWGKRQTVVSGGCAQGPRRKAPADSVTSCAGCCAGCCTCALLHLRGFVR